MGRDISLMLYGSLEALGGELGVFLIQAASSSSHSLGFGAFSLVGATVNIGRLVIGSNSERVSIFNPPKRIRKN